VTERVHASGGFTRDLIYLRGLLSLVEYIRAGGDIEPLYLWARSPRSTCPSSRSCARGNYLMAPALLPRLFEHPDTAQRMDALRNGLP
jgi:hypothetical protein